MAVRISYKDGANWIPISGINIQYFGSSRILNETTRIIPTILAPISIIDVWNGDNIKIQEQRFDSYTLQFACKEDQLNEISRIKSCDTINIVDISNAIDHLADNTTSESFQILEPEKIANTTNYIIRIIYRTDRTIIDKIATRPNVVTLQGNSTYTSKFDKLTFNAPPIKIEVPWSDGTVKVLRETLDQGFSVLLYFNDSELRTFLDDYGQNTFTIDTVPVIKKNNPEVTPIAYNLNKVIISVVTATIRTTDLAQTGVSQTNNILIDSVNNFYTDFAPNIYYENTEQGFSNNEQGYGVLNYAITRKVTELKFYLNDSDLAIFKVGFEASQDVKLNTVQVLENRLVESSKLDNDINEVSAVCLTATEIKYPQQ